METNHSAPWLSRQPTWSCSSSFLPLEGLGKMLKLLRELGEHTLALGADTPWLSQVDGSRGRAVGSGLQETQIRPCNLSSGFSVLQQNYK